MQIQFQRHTLGPDGSWGARDNTSVMYAEWVDLSEFVQHQSKLVGAPSDVAAAAASSNQAPYRLSGVTVHIGSTPRSGHYMHYFRIGEQWFLANDSKVNPVKFSVVMRECRTAYLLTYIQEPMP